MGKRTQSLFFGLRRGRAGVTFGVQLDAVGSDVFGADHGGGHRVHEQTDPHTACVDLLDQRAQTLGVLGESPAVVAGELVLAVRHKGALVQRQAPGRQVPHKIHQVLGRVAFDVELAVRPILHQGGDFIHVVSADVPLIRPRVDGDALRAGLQAQLGRTQHARDAQVAGVAQQRDLVDVDGQGGFHGVLLGH